MKSRSQIQTLQPQTIHSLSHRVGDLRRRVATRLMREFGFLLPPPLIRRVLDEALEVAQETGFPNLFFPALAEEKARTVFAALRHPSFAQAPRTLRDAA